eukprot:969558-Pleurochrysis_carterae.AAC.1
MPSVPLRPRYGLCSPALRCARAAARRLRDPAHARANGERCIEPCETVETAVACVRAGVRACETLAPLRRSAARASSSRK